MVKLKNKFPITPMKATAKPTMSIDHLLNSTVEK